MADEKQFLGSAPYFVVADIGRSVDYYCDVLGFERRPIWGEPPCFCMPQRDGLIVMLSQVEGDVAIVPTRERGGYWDAYFWVRDADALFAEFVERGAIIDYEPCIQKEYGMKEFGVRDLDGYLLAFGQAWDG